MRWRTVLQPMTTVKASAGLATTIQDLRFVVRPGPGAGATAFVNVYRNTFTATSTFNLETASTLEVSTVVPGTSGAFWATVATNKTVAASPGGVGVLRFTNIKDVGDFLRWTLLTNASGEMDFDIVLWFDETAR